MTGAPEGRGAGSALDGPALLEGARRLREPFLSLLETLVLVESPTGDEEANRRLAGLLAEGLEARGGRVGRRDAPGYGQHLVARFAGETEVEGGPLLVVGHMDTVHPVGTLERLPFRVGEERVTGPGAYDMKGGVALALSALDLLASEGAAPRGDVVVLVTCDEEVGSPTSRPLIEELARDARGALVLEPPVAGGGAKTRRKGVAEYAVRVRGVPAHAGIEPEKGASAVHALVGALERVLEAADPEAGTTVNVGVIRGGTRGNVVAEHAEATVDVRFWTDEEARRVDAAFRDLESPDERCELEVAGGVNRGALEKTDASARLFATARELAASFGYDLDEGRTGGGSDGNLTAAVGCPTLDGLGLDGGGAHSPDEHFLVAEIAPRIALVAGLLRTL